MAAGVIYKVGSAPTGFGEHIVVMHPNVPHPEDPSKKVDLYSGYAHLSQIIVQEGDKVGKGQTIGYSGNTGASTAPHLHWQVEYDTPPFHLYWPFTYQDVVDAGYSSYFDGVRFGVGQDKIREHMIHPSEYVEQFIRWGQTEYASAGVIDSAEPDGLETNYMDGDETNNHDYVGDEDDVDEVDNSDDMRNTDVLNSNPEEDFEIENNEAVDTENKDTRNEETPTATPEEDKDGRGSHNTESEEAAEDEGPKDVNKDNDMLNSAPKKFEIRHDVEPVAAVFTDVATIHPLYGATKKMAEMGVVKGYADGSFGGEKTLNRAEAMTMVMRYLDEDGGQVRARMFTDAVGDEWFMPFVARAVELGLVKGYEDGSLQAERIMTRAEFLKVAITAAKKPTQASEGQAWFTPYMDYAIAHQLLRESGKLLDPHAQITRAEAVEVLYNLL